MRGSSQAATKSMVRNTIETSELRCGRQAICDAVIKDKLNTGLGTANPKGKKVCHSKSWARSRPITFKLERSCGLARQGPLRGTPLAARQGPQRTPFWGRTGPRGWGGSWQTGGKLCGNGRISPQLDEKQQGVGLHQQHLFPGGWEIANQRLAVGF